MKKLGFLLGTVLVLASCHNDDITAPAELDALFDSGGILAWDAAGMSGPGRFLGGLHRLPENLRLTQAQSAAIAAAVDAYMRATAADREALARIHEAAAEARKSGKTREEIRAILQQGDPIRERLEAAEKALLEKINSILTAEQKAWLEANTPKRCDPRTAPPLTAEQRTQIAALIANYETANKTDIEAVRAALEQARIAHENGASREQVRAILEAVRPAMERLAAAQAALRAAIDALLTAEQLASGCYNRPGAVLIVKHRDR